MKKLLLFFITILILTGCNKTYYCPDGYNETDKYCEKEKEKEPEKKLSCKYGYSLKDDKCYYETKTVASLKYVCPNGYTLNGSTCKKTGGTVTDKCGKNHVEVNGYCFSDIQASQTYDCVGGTKEGSYCIEVVYTEPTVEYLCESGYNLIDNKCIKKERIKKLEK